MVGRSDAYRQGFNSKYCDNPFEMGSQEYNDFERGWSQKAKRFPNSVESKYKHKRFEQSLPESKSKVTEPKSYNSYAKAKGK
ncbi:hypothetical protein V9789_004395 [Vibrio vulnificus]|uniref:Uncharacterized protein n=1 Tax=Vibrio aestuarianus TaxID=28171 RepID=A0ABM9FUK8_9VIBR|nr:MULTISPECIES: hypothetical protein [Vibrio]EHH1183149.1 hypothetical protein [Vibrio vulnificus]EHH1191939.1 hypothetical protein [Vibrio vulnificus]EHH2475087.1 hypothetical protein [Vibrio vulnificus]EHU4933573.1 hypothetical protein [Vibrio vulnificus]EIJ0985176.1 hypothetical protein [Vibrio vulnificus]